MPKTIIFRADGNSSTGLGHLYRLFSLVEIVKSSFEFIFVTKTSSTHGIIPTPYKIRLIPDSVGIGEEPNWLAEHFSPKDHIIISDGYQFVSSYQKLIKNKGFKYMYIDDLAQEHMFADVVINHSPYMKEGDYKKEDYTGLALGTKHALLRPAFLNETKNNREISKIDTVFLCFGGADPYDLTFEAAKALLDIKDIKKIIVILGGAYKFKKITELKKNNSSTIEIYRNLSENDIVQVLKKCNFAIVPASTILFEVCCVKMPVLSGFYVDNQELIYKGLLNKNAIFEAGNMAHFKSTDFKEKLSRIMTNRDFKSQITAQKELFDDKIAERHLKLITELC